MKKAYFAAALMILLPVCAFGAGAGIEAGLTLKNDDVAQPGLFPSIDVRLYHSFGGLVIDAILGIGTDGKYAPFMDDWNDSAYLVLKRGGISYEADPFFMLLGRFCAEDAVDSPYSLYVSSVANPAIQGLFSYDDGFFIYSTRWIELNRDSSIYRIEVPLDGGGTLSVPVDRGANVRTFGLRIGEWRFLYQEVAVYTGRSFDLEYFLSPIPAVITQYIHNLSGAPWQTGPWYGGIANDNAIQGCLIDWTGEDHWAYIQILIDDINLNRIIDPDSYQNPDKIAVSAGWRGIFSFGTIGAFAALATKYVFEPFGGSTTNTMYGYTYYPDTTYGSDGRGIPLEMQYVGYMHGENNLALMVEWSNTYEGIFVRAACEYLVAGSSSPGNPWHELETWVEGGQGTKFLDEPILQHRLTFEADASYSFGWMEVGASLLLGYVWNELQIVEMTGEFDDPNGIDIWKPSDTSRFLFAIGITVSIYCDFATGSFIPSPN